MVETALTTETGPTVGTVLIARCRLTVLAGTPRRGVIPLPAALVAAATAVVVATVVVATMVAVGEAASTAVAVEDHTAAVAAIAKIFSEPTPWPASVRLERAFLFFLRLARRAAFATPSTVPQTLLLTPC